MKLLTALAFVLLVLLPAQARAQSITATALTGTWAFAKDHQTARTSPPGDTLVVRPDSTYYVVLTAEWVRRAKPAGTPTKASKPSYWYLRGNSLMMSPVRQQELPTFKVTLKDQQLSMTKLYGDQKTLLFKRVDTPKPKP